MPLEWAATQNNLGLALWRLGERENRQRASRGRHSLRAALQEYTRERAPLDWAEAQASLGDVLIELGQRTRVSPDVDEGRSAIAAAWEVYEAAGYAQYRDDVAMRLQEADRIPAEIRNSTQEKTYEVNRFRTFVPIGRRYLQNGRRWKGNRALGHLAAHR